MLNDRYLRQSAVTGFENLAQNLSDKRVGIVGLGGLGGLCAYLLVGAGLKNLKLCDFDEVSLSNLHRQVMYDQTSLGLSKAQVLKQRLLNLDESVKVELFPKFEEHNAAIFNENLDLILDLTDKVQVRELISDKALSSKVPLIEASVSNTRGQIALFNYKEQNFVKEHGCFRCLAKNMGHMTSPGILGPVASAMASLVALYVMQYFQGQIEAGKIRFIDFLNFKSTEVVLRPDLTCTCQKESS